MEGTMKNDGEREGTIIDLAPHRWAKKDKELERYCRTPWLRYGGNLRDGNHRTHLPCLDELERGWG
jgi:hypothetical protein